ncbi:hypothetical protein DS745_12530 [Anaerobacillus alkaliphilus]|uniref:Uncharacterized protein n=1 Tax=Anaerobacillus alkaliphilus TaxID=1548597 RepID=A0A4Q0VS99_9BACI|nr:DUF6407 family protein [Anaerobacillus alkaliphilus]RXJ00351.1 hypothetical protein DS745_12530 [Anaerobacillus alkaliphilus]
MNLSEFVQVATKNIVQFNPHNMDHLKELTRLAIDQFQLKSIVKKEEGSEYLYLASMAEENILAKILELASGKEISLEAIYNSQIIRKH